MDLKKYLPWKTNSKKQNSLPGSQAARKSILRGALLRKGKKSAERAWKREIPEGTPRKEYKTRQNRKENGVSGADLRKNAVTPIGGN